jgi:hypothetical protein
MQLGHAGLARMRFEMRDQPRADALALQAGLDEQRPELVAAEADRADDPGPVEANEDVTLDQPLRDLVRCMVGGDQLDDRGLRNRLNWTAARSAG